MSRVFYADKAKKLQIEELEPRIVLDASVDVVDQPNNPDNPDNPDSQDNPDAENSEVPNMLEIMGNIQSSDDPLAEVFGDQALTKTLSTNVNLAEIDMVVDKDTNSAYGYIEEKSFNPNQIEFLLDDPSIKNSDLRGDLYIDGKADVDGVSYKFIAPKIAKSVTENEIITVEAEDGTILAKIGNQGELNYFFSEHINITEQQWDAWSADGEVKFIFNFSPDVEQEDGVWNSFVDGIFRSGDWGYCSDCNFVYLDLHWSSNPDPPPEETTWNPPGNPPETPFMNLKPSLPEMDSSFHADLIDPRISYITSEFNADFTPRPLVPIPDFLFSPPESDLELINTESPYILPEPPPEDLTTLCNYYQHTQDGDRLIFNAPERSAMEKHVLPDFVHYEKIHDDCFDMVCADGSCVVEEQPEPEEEGPYYEIGEPIIEFESQWFYVCPCNPMDEEDDQDKIK